MKVSKLVSVIIIFYNAERFLAEAINSVQAQTYPHWELLLVDDGSTDGSTALAQQAVAAAPGQLRYLQHTGHANRGMSAARNLGIQHAQGQYLAFLDADDVWLPEKLAQQVACLERQPAAGMVYGPVEWWYSWTERLEDQGRDQVLPLGVPADTLLPPPNLLSRFFFQQSASNPGPSSILVRREIVEQVGGFEEAFRGAYEDQVFLAKICLRASVVALSESLDRYRQHPDSYSSRLERAGNERDARGAFLGWLGTYLEEQGISNPDLRRGLEQVLWPFHHPRLDRLGTTCRTAARRGRRAAIGIARLTVPAPARYWLRAQWTSTDYSPPTGWVRFGHLRRLTPLSRQFGYDRGRPVDRVYIERFLGVHTADVRGHVLEIAGDTYTREFGGDQVCSSDVLHVESGQTGATIVGDLTCQSTLPADAFDCVILTQTLQFIYDVPAALRTINRSLKPGGVILTTVPGITPISRYDMDRWGQFWGFTSLSGRRLFEDACSWDDVQVESFGNVLTAASVLYGIAAEELHPQELDYHDPDYEVIIAIRATKAKGEIDVLNSCERHEAGIHHLGV